MFRIPPPSVPFRHTSPTNLGADMWARLEEGPLPEIPNLGSSRTRSPNRLDLSPTDTGADPAARLHKNAVNKSILHYMVSWRHKVAVFSVLLK
jgi:hypothetical protein